MNWREFQKKVSPGNLYQSLEWGKVHENNGGKFFLWQNKIGQEITAGAALLKYNLPFNKNYLYVPLGPIGKMTEKTWSDFFVNAKEIAINERSFFIRFYADNINKNLIKLYDVRKAPNNYFLSAGNIPSDNARIQLAKSKEEILSCMHEKTRYNIRLAQKRGVAVKNFVGENIFNQLEVFFNLLKSTAQKKEFSLHSRVHYEHLLKNFKDNLNLFIAYYDKRAMACALILAWGNVAYYLHGGTDLNFRSLMTPHLLHWEIIKFYQNDGFLFYDLGAVSSKKFPVQKWAGITRFKLCFGAKLYSLPQAYDFVINKPIYFLYNFARKFV